MALVVDVSAIISLAFSDENPVYARAVIDAISSDYASVPTLFWFELRNSLVIGERRKRTSTAQTAAILGRLGRLWIEMDFQPRENAVLDFARRYQLTVYDAAYLELAARRSMPLATLDRALISAAVHAGVAIWQPG